MPKIGVNYAKNGSKLCQKWEQIMPKMGVNYV